MRLLAEPTRSNVLVLAPRREADIVTQAMAQISAVADFQCASPGIRR